MDDFCWGSLFQRTPYSGPKRLVTRSRNMRGPSSFGWIQRSDSSFDPLRSGFWSFWVLEFHHSKHWWECFFGWTPRWSKCKLHLLQVAEAFGRCCQMGARLWGEVLDVLGGVWQGQNGWMWLSKGTSELRWHFDAKQTGLLHVISHPVYFRKKDHLWHLSA